MKKKLVAVLICVCMISNLTACGDKQAAATPSADEAVESTAVSDNQSISADEADDEEEVTEPESLTGFNMIDNGGLDNNIDGWFEYYESSGKGTLEWKDGMLSLAIENNGIKEHSCQIYYDGFKLEQGCVYEIQFDAASTIERTVQYRIQINGGDYHYYSGEYITLTPEMQHYDIVFTMEEASDPAPRLCFNAGCIEGEGVLDAHTITFDNFELYCTDESGRVAAAGGVETPAIRVNQVGYKPNENKVAVFSEKIDDTFKIVDASSGKEVYSGTTGEAQVNDNTGLNEAKADFSDFTTPGTYKIVGENAGESYEFTIAEDVYDDAFVASIRMFYMARCGEALDESVAGDFTHEVCHNAKAVLYDDTSKSIDVSGGWHDAGDYGRYVVAGAKAASDMLLAYELYPTAFDDNVGIPESGNGVADVLDETRYELEWMLKMQESDGGVHHKVTCANFPEVVMPEEETEQLIVMPVSTTATGAFAAVMAQAARVYEDVDAKFSAECFEASELAYSYLEKNSEMIGYTNPDDIVTGEYKDDKDIDERFWAAAELFKTTGEAEYEKKVAELIKKEIPADLGWASVGLYGAFAYATSGDKISDKTTEKAAVKMLTDAADAIMANASKDTYNCSLYGDYPWGSNMTVANNAMALIMCRIVTGNDYDAVIEGHLDYLLGNNGTSYCYLTGFGTLSPLQPHHRPSQVVGSPVPGMIVGGPNNALEDPYAQNVLADAAPQLCYVDNSQSFSCNEIAIYWNSPFVFLMTYMQDK